MRNFIGRLDPAFDRYLKTSGFLLNWIAVVMFCVMLGANSYNIFLRTVLDQGTMWHQEVSIMAAFWIYFAAYALLSKEDGFIRVEFVVERFAPSTQYWIFVAVRLAIVTFHVTLFIFCVRTFKLIAIYETPILQWPEYLYYIPLVVGTFDIIVTEIIHFLRTLAFPERAPVEAGPSRIAV
jgi:TRAP-type C4-dicarboxylate transport system permease small subunit